ncbi:chromatin assembly complex protein [Mycena metata]|uniref:Chromatin assembly complex protein n=1 Tax=Mycena metata TaxID=1033252 RepID=A0AAD7HVK4_9AGAR|nr:chromatin assembly complex protein [Mycena metata]
MRFRTLEIRWHDSKPISSCDFQPVPFKKARPASSSSNTTTGDKDKDEREREQAEREKWAAQAYRLATAGEDNHVRVWMVHPNIRAVLPGDKPQEKGEEKPRPARVEYLATLSRHSAAVNVVRFSPNGELIASAGDDGMVIIWAPSLTPPAHSAFASSSSDADPQLEKEFWKPRTTFRCTTMQVYDLAWSPSGEFLVAGSTDNVGRVFASADGRPLLELASHTHFVQGVAWDPLNEYLATQSSDRAMHVYRITQHGHGGDKGTFEAHAIGRNTRFPAPSHSHSHHSHSHDARRGRAHSRTPSVHRDDLGGLSLPTPALHAHAHLPSINTNTGGMGMGTPLNTPAGTEWKRPQVQRMRSASMESDRTGGGAGGEWEMPAPGTPASVASYIAAGAEKGEKGGASSSMFPPPAGAGAGPSSRRSSFSGSNAPSSPGFSAVSGFSRFGRSPSPMPALPAIRTPPSSGAGWARHGGYEERTRSRERGGSGARYPNADASSSSSARYAPDTYDERRHPEAGTRLYGDESYSNFFRRLAFSPDGALLLTPAGTFEDPSASVAGWEGTGGATTAASTSGGEGSAHGAGAGSVTPDAGDTPARGRKARPVISTSTPASASSSVTPAPAPASTTTPPETGSASSVYIYSRANFARPPVAQLPGHKKASVAVRFSPVLYELRAGVQGGGASASHAGSQQAGGGEPRMGTGTATGEEGEWERSRDAEETIEVDLVGPLASSSSSSAAAGGSTIAAPAPQQHASFNVLASPALSPADLHVRRPPTPAASKPSTPAPGHASSSSVPPSSTPALTGSVFALPYRMLYAVVTMDTVAIYDTQQAGPVCLLTKLHYDEFTDLTWSPDGQCLMLSSRDGYCTLVTFDEILPTHHTQQAALQLQQIAAQHSVPISYAHSGSGSQAGGSRKRPLEPLTPAASVDGDRERDVVMPPTPMPTPGGSGSGSGMGMGMTASTSGTSISSLDTEATGAEGEADGPPKKKRRVALTRVGDL